MIGSDETQAAAAPHIVADQSAIFDFMGDPATYGMSTRPKRIDTQNAAVFLAGAHAYKVKRAVKYPFMDLSTLEKRKAACEAEIAVNIADAPDIYLGVVPITRDTSGNLRIGGDGAVVEWAVQMRRFDERQTLDHVAEAGDLTPQLIARLVEAILASHDRAPRHDGKAATESLRLYLQHNAEAYAEHPGLFDAKRAAALTRRAQAALADVWDLLIKRGRAGFVRRCHGDLHLRNVILINGAPTLFDAVEFDDAIATGDVLYDLAYLLMDLLESERKAEASLVFNRYLWGSDAQMLPGLAAMPIFLSIRAGIRAKVDAAGLAHHCGERLKELTREVHRYFAFAETALEPVPPRLIAIGGLSGSGKTTLAAAIAPFLGRPPGAVHIRSDVERKRLAGVAETKRLPESAYTAAEAKKVYAVLMRKAGLALNAGYTTIVDAAHIRPEERQAIAALAAEAGVPFSGLWLQAPEDTLIERVRTRQGDASDATEAVVRRQLGLDTGTIGWTALPATGTAAALTKRALALLARS